MGERTVSNVSLFKNIQAQEIQNLTSFTDLERTVQKPEPHWVALTQKFSLFLNG